MLMPKFAACNAQAMCYPSANRFAANMGLLNDERIPIPLIRRYGGKLIHSSRDEQGILEVVDAFGVRSLHFGTSPRQSAIALADPGRLELSYVRAMLSALIFMPEPRKVLLLGLGGGTLASFLLAHFTECTVDAVERRKGVMEIAHVFFSLPRDRRLRIHIAEASEFVSAQSRTLRGAFDLVLVDAYDHQGMDGSINVEEFFRDCDRLLTDQGALSINLWGTQRKSFAETANHMRACFSGRCLKLPVPNKGNIIGLAMGAKLKVPDKDTALARAKYLEIGLGLELPYFLRCLRPM
jgi:spermidine synthase